MTRPGYVDQKQLIVPATFKQAEGDENLVSGLSAVYENVDLDGDRIKRGAFDNEPSRERVESGLVKLFDTHTWTVKGTLGIVVDIKERPEGLETVSKFSRTRDAQEARVKALEGVITHQSVAFRTLTQTILNEDPEGAFRDVNEALLWENSLVPMPANLGAAIGETKAQDLKAVVRFQDFPLAGRARPWDSTAAIRRLREATGSEDEPSRAFRRGFVWFDAEKSDEFGSYKLPIADVIGGEIKAVPRGIFAAAGALVGARGGVDIPERDMGRARAHLSRYFAKMREAFDDETIVPPWEQERTAKKFYVVRGVVDGPEGAGHLLEEVEVRSEQVDDRTQSPLRSKTSDEGVVDEPENEGDSITGSDLLPEVLRAETEIARRELE